MTYFPYDTRNIDALRCMLNFANSKARSYSRDFRQTGLETRPLQL